MNAPGDAVFPGGVGVSGLRVYDWAAADGVCGGSPHMHLACAEAYVVVAGEGAVQTLTWAGYAETPLRPGEVVWFTPGTIHRLINGDGGLRIVVIMQNSGLPEAGDAVFTFPAEVLDDAARYEKAAAAADEEGARRRGRPDQRPMGWETLSRPPRGGRPADGDGSPLSYGPPSPPKCRRTHHENRLQGVRRVNSTLVVVAGEGTDRVIAGLDGLNNVRTVIAGDRSPAEVTDIVTRASATYVVHDADPLARVREGWVDLFDETAPVGGLEVAIEAAIRNLRTDAALLPDYYIVLDPQDMPPTRRHWWLGVLAGTAPTRVVPAPATAEAVRASLAGLVAGRWWPDPADAWLRELPRVVPDQAGLPT